jgi:hypothetical protein
MPSLYGEYRNKIKSEQAAKKPDERVARVRFNPNSLTFAEYLLLDYAFRNDFTAVVEALLPKTIVSWDFEVSMSRPENAGDDWNVLHNLTWEQSLEVQGAFIRLAAKYHEQVLTSHDIETYRLPVTWRHADGQHFKSLIKQAEKVTGLFDGEYPYEQWVTEMLEIMRPAAFEPLVDDEEFDFHNGTLTMHLIRHAVDRALSGKN